MICPATRKNKLQLLMRYNTKKPIVFVTGTILSITFFVSCEFLSGKKDDGNNRNYNEGTSLFLSSSPLTSKSWDDVHFTNLCQQRMTKCEGIQAISNNDQTTQIRKPSKLQYLLSKLNIYSLPIPRIVSKDDQVFNYKEMKTGLQERKKSEEDLIQLKKEFNDSSKEQKADVAFVKGFMNRFVEVMYGCDVTESIRQKYLQTYGCTGWTDEILSCLYKLGIDQNRGILEIGAGNGNWYRAIKGYYLEKQNRRNDDNFEYIVAFDDYSSLPLPINSNTVRRGNHKDALNFLKEERPTHLPSRVLLLVYPSPGEMAYESVMEYTNSNPKNDTVVYVGEGRGGANANNDFFDLFNDGNWALMNLMDVWHLEDEVEEGRISRKSLEKCFVLKRVHNNTSSNNNNNNNNAN